MQFRDLQKQYKELKSQVDDAIVRVCTQAHFIAGTEVHELELELANYVGCKHCITCGNGTDALTLALLTWGVGPGDAVFVPDFTFFSSGECPAGVGATPIFVDVDPYTYNIDPVHLEKAILQVKSEGALQPKVVVAVDLFGLPANYEEIRPLCDKYGLLLLEDGAQGFGGSIDGKKACSFGDISTTSFFPAKPLGCYGDGGAIFTDNDEWAALIRSYAVHGKSGEDKYDNIRIGMNSRLDTIQAAILRIKLKALQNYELSTVNQAAMWYNEKLDIAELILPRVPERMTSSWAQYTIQLPEHVNRNTLRESLKEYGIPTMIYYSKPMHQQGAFAGTRSSIAKCPVTERICRTVLSLPMHPYITKAEVNQVVEALNQHILNL